MSPFYYRDRGETVEVALPNPNPHNFKFHQLDQFGEFCVCYIHYPDCTTFEGNKILIFRARIEDIKKRTSIDPHFSESPYSPIARFPATAQGWDDAADYAKRKAVA